MRKFILILLLSTCLSVYSQNNFADIKAELDRWFQSATTDPNVNAKIPQSIHFPTQKYTLIGVIAKGKLCEGTTARFYDTSSLVPNLLLEGSVSYQAGRLVIEGIRNIETSSGCSRIYGSFYVYNMDDFTFNCKPKTAGELRINRDKESYLEGTYRERPAIVSIGQKNTVYLGKKLGKKDESKTFTFLSAPIPNITFNDDGSFDLYPILLQAKDDVTMCWEDGTIFNGIVRPTPMEDDLIAFLPIEGHRTGMPIGPEEIAVIRENGNIVYTERYGIDYRSLSKASYIVVDNGRLLEEDYWRFEKILEHCKFVKWIYKNGNVFEGTVKTSVEPVEGATTNSISITPAQGVFKYPNGDRFEGNMSSKLVGPFFVDGTTFFTDGTKTEGNWLDKFTLEDYQWEKVYKCSNPSEAIDLARKILQYNNEMEKYREYISRYEEYAYSKEITYFEPSVERLETIYGSSIIIIYDTSMKRYICKNPDSSKIELEFTVDGNGYRNWEIVYSDGEPKYINEYAWYSNDVIKSIKSYSYDTKRLYLSCNFFSDGKLRSAYLYQQSKTGEIVLRKSKESHPKYGGYTCKLYDLTGNYERSIEWKIGTNESLWGTYDIEMAPSQFHFNQLLRIFD